ncbi:MAG: hypothetical protein JRE14_07485 [Deltaproteobacteria bacterium]|nr:hypothetical protein [Deltaproteobacteria bacterium]
MDGFNQAVIQLFCDIEAGDELPCSMFWCGESDRGVFFRIAKSSSGCASPGSYSMGCLFQSSFRKVFPNVAEG